MINERFATALSRIEAAASRLDALVVSPPVADDTAGLAELGERHHRLRAATADALSRLDRLIAKQGEEG